ncbi:MAG: DeoR/GlpR family DNA-binding transcription regulator [Rhodospirillum sp.]|nr:DeoR/GlpR family DNA-binding transcription regulator [Rhodospirillum sp.]MCF8489324.1 DeoR/GlpR family DNA-binding transcription regulator [Rhodospirillum sp.]MCF8502403.1 DeoR/GlpR family DNA-binding transcription regulator [Rhodospirillum sp.]
MPDFPSSAVLESNTVEEPTARQRRLLSLVAAQGFGTIEALAEGLDISSQTVRRDINALCDLGLLQRFHGGASLPPDLPARENAPVRLGYGRKSTTKVAEKARIGAAVAGFIPDGSSIFLDVGTTLEAVAEAVARHHRGPRVVTCGLLAASAFAGHDGAQVFVTGGMLRGADGSIVGESAIRAVEGFKVDYAVLGLSAIDADGALTDFDADKVALKQAAIRIARKVILAVDSSKFGRTALLRVTPLSTISIVVTDRSPDPEIQALLESEGVDLVIA